MCVVKCLEGKQLFICIRPLLLLRRLLDTYTVALHEAVIHNIILHRSQVPIQLENSIR